MNNKQLGTDFETEFCELLANRGYWVHFISPDRRGAQPFDVIAVKGGEAYAYDCKTSAKRKFNIGRMEENQKTAFDLWMRCGNKVPRVAVKYRDHIYIILYTVLKQMGTVDLMEDAVCYL